LRAVSVPFGTARTVGGMHTHSRIPRRAGLAIVAGLVAMSSVAVADARSAQPVPRKHPTVAHQAASSCSPARASTARSAYGWPLKPFLRQHPVRGFFGDPRLADKTFRGDNHGSFHFGVDVSAPDGTAVYATISGRVVLEAHRRETVAIRADDGRTVFAYWHLDRAVQNGERVTAYRTVVGNIAAGWGHVHFAESRDGLYLNPLRRGAMGPYTDRTCPWLRHLRLEQSDRAVRGSHAAGTVALVVEAYDRVPMPVPGAWAGKPVVPATIAWRLVSSAGSRTAWRLPFDVATALPRCHFASAYARWTRQNSAHRAGRYRLYLTHSLDTTLFADGSYVVVVRATDTAGNATRALFPLTVSNS
jgi:hypothetical protein